MMERQLPEIDIAGTRFIADVRNDFLVQKDDELNKIRFSDMVDKGTHYEFDYDPTFKTMHFPFDDHSGVIRAMIPLMVELDPEGMAARYGLSLEEVKKRTDFEIIANPELVKLRENGVLPIIEIAGHPFFVDLRMDSLRPKDDFSTQGIRFSEIEHCLLEDDGVYHIPYNPKTKAFADLDFDEITAIPKDVILIEVPRQPQLDPIGFARKYGCDPKDMLRAYPPVANMKARIVPWKETPIGEIIARNVEKAKKLAGNMQKKNTKRKGRRI